MKRMNRAVAMFAGALALAAGATACSSEHRVESAAPETASGVTVTVARSTSVPDWLEAVGTVTAAHSSQIASQTTGNLVEVRAREGDCVTGQQVLAVIDDTQQRAAVEQASAALNAASKGVALADSDYSLAEATERRYSQLFEKKSISPQEYDEIKARLQSAEARRDLARAGVAQAQASLTQAQTALSYTQVRAPFAGLVVEKKAETGALAAPGVLLFTIEDTQRYRLEASLDESDVRLARVGEAVSVSLDALGSAELKGTVAQVVPAADPASRSFLVKIELPADARVHSGLFGRARFPRGTRSAILIPQASIVERGQLRAVYVIDANRTAQLHYVTLGAPSGSQTEILSGLQAGETLVAAPGDRDLGGKQIALRP